MAKLCSQTATDLGLCSLAKLMGLLHDWGKSTVDMQNYLRDIGDVHPHHAALGASFVWQCWGKTAQNILQRQTAQLISLCIYGHHASLPDCLNISGESPYLAGMNEACVGKYYEEAQRNFYNEVASQEELNELFALACKEMEGFSRTKSSFEWGMLARLLLSILVDADRWDSACFGYDEDPFPTDQEFPPVWRELLFCLEKHLELLPQDGAMAEIRRNISMQCRRAGEFGPGIYTLSALTGGGKTYASLRFGLAQAEKNQQQRIFYFIPMNTILDQNAKDIRDALGNYPSILEHHSNVVWDSEVEKENYRRLTERWDSRIILTSLVNFLETLFQNGNSKARRMHRLANSVLIFDEIQALPGNCRGLFERAIQFLVRYCNCTVLLCTATQPRLNLEAKELIPDVDLLYQKLNRVTYVSQLQPRSYREAARDIVSLVQAKQSVLTVVNTREAAGEVFQKVYAHLSEAGYHMVEVQPGLFEKAVDVRAEESGADEILCVHLSTLMCPAHRKEIIYWIRAWLEHGKSVCCISTALIEAGIDVSFPVVIRSLAGIPSIIQAAGRCNRNCKDDRGVVYLWNLSEERLGRLPDIKRGKEISMNLLGRINDLEEIGRPELIETYFAKEEAYTQEVERYLYEEWNSDLVTMLSTNKECVSVAKDCRENPQADLSKRLCQSFRTAGKVFEVIDQKTRVVLVPYRKGKSMIEKLSKPYSLYEEIQSLRDAQQYSVNLFDEIFERLKEEKALYYVGESGIAVIKEEYYDARTGVKIPPQEKGNHEGGAC